MSPAKSAVTAMLATTAAARTAGVTRCEEVWEEDCPSAGPTEVGAPGLDEVKDAPGIGRVL